MASKKSTQRVGMTSTGKVRITKPAKGLVAKVLKAAGK